LKFHVVAWVLGMVVIAPLKALIERQDNGAFERLSTNSQPGSWDPWVVYVGGIWALVIAGLALVVYIDRRRRRAGAATRGDLDRAAKPTNQPLRRFHTLPGV
jgi:hypothetical protein